MPGPQTPSTPPTATPTSSAPPTAPPTATPIVPPTPTAPPTPTPTAPPTPTPITTDCVYSYDAYANDPFYDDPYVAYLANCVGAGDHGI